MVRNVNLKRRASICQANRIDLQDGSEANASRICQVCIEIDVVLVSTPDHTHFVATLASMERGKHVFVQKPLTELCCLGTLALRTGKQVDCDPDSMSFKDESLNQYLKAPVRKGWAYGEDL